MDLFIPAKAVDCFLAIDCNLNPSTSTDSSVTVETQVPSVTVEQRATQFDPAVTFPVEFDIQFSEPIDPASFDLTDLTFGGTSTGAVWELVNSGDDQNYTLSATSVASGGTLVPSLAAGVATDLAANPNTTSTSDDNEVTFINKIDDVAFASRSSSSIEINWTEPEQNNATVQSYDTYYRENGSVVWILFENTINLNSNICLLYTSPSPRDATLSRMPSSA